MKWKEDLDLVGNLRIVVYKWLVILDPVDFCANAVVVGPFGW